MCGGSKPQKKRMGEPHSVQVMGRVEGHMKEMRQENTDVNNGVKITCAHVGGSGCNIGGVLGEAEAVQR